MNRYKTGLESRKKLYESARKLFIEKGFEQTSVREIVEAADSKLGLFTYYFDSKASLALQMNSDFLHNFYDAITDLIIKNAAEFPNGGKNKLLNEMISYRCLYKTLFSNEGVAQLWEDTCYLPTFIRENYERRQNRLRELSDHPRTESDLKVLVSISIGMENQLFKDLTSGYFKELDEVLDAFLFYFYKEVSSNAEEYTELSREYAARITCQAFDDLTVELSFK